MFLGYIDDSGRFQKKKQTYLVLSVVLLHDKLFSSIEDEVGLCVDDVIPEEKWDLFEEFHACELYGGYGVFEGISQELRFGAIRKLLSIVRDYKIPVIYGAVNIPRLKQQTYASANPMDVAFRSCLPKISELMGKEQYEHGPEYALLIADDGDRDNRLLLKKTFKELRKQVRPPDWHPGVWYVHDDMYFGSSKDSIGIQLADLCSYFIGKHLENDESTEGFYQIFSDLIIASEVIPD